jgi:cyclophilin family peptidyl-prolyl cis-trans isomerase
VGTEKRERQKQARHEKIEALRHQEHRESVRRRGVMIGAAIAAFVAFAIGFSVLTADDGDDAQTIATDDDDLLVEDENEDPLDEDLTDPIDDADPETPPEADASEELDEVEDALAEPLPCPDPEGADERVTEFPAAPPMCIDPNVDYTATVQTDAGPIRFDLLEDEAPITVNNFVYLARYGYYDGLTFHRVIPDFVLQGGDPRGDGTGGPGYQFEDELPEPEDYQAGSLAMANAGPDTNGSQFFVVTSEEGAEVLVDAVGGEAAYSLFGQIIEGMDVVAEIEADGTPSGTPSEVHVIESVTIEEA